MDFTKIVNGNVPDETEWMGNYTAILIHNAINNFKVLQANNVFENGDYGFVDENVDSNGTNNTINTESSTAIFNINKYGLSNGVEQGSIASTNFDQVSSITWSGTINGSSGYFSEIGAQVNNASGTLTIQVKKGAVVVATKNVSITGFANYNVSFDSSDYSDTFNDGDTFSLVFSGVSGIRRCTTSATKSSGIVQYTSQLTIGGRVTQPTLYKFQTASVSSGTLIHDRNTYTLDGNEKGIIIYNKKTIDSNSNILYDVSDGQPDTGNGDGTNDTTTTNLNNENSVPTIYSQGIKVQTKEDLIFKSVTKHSSCTATRCRIRLNSSTTYYEATFSGNIATFTEDIFVASGTTIYVECDNNGSSFISVYDNYNTGSHTYTFPITGTYLDITGGASTTLTATVTYYNIASIVTQTATNNYIHTIPNKNSEEYIDITNLSSGTLKITEKLSTTDKNGRAETYGISVVVVR